PAKAGMGDVIDPDHAAATVLPEGLSGWRGAQGAVHFGFSVGFGEMVGFKSIRCVQGVRGTVAHPVALPGTRGGKRWAIVAVSPRVTDWPSRKAIRLPGGIC